MSEWKLFDRWREVGLQFFERSEVGGECGRGSTRCTIDKNDAAQDLIVVQTFRAVAVSDNWCWGEELKISKINLKNLYVRRTSIPNDR